MKTLITILLLSLTSCKKEVPELPKKLPMHRVNDWVDTNGKLDTVKYK